jgi:branched-chain amino acid aminotransferase
MEFVPRRRICEQRREVDDNCVDATSGWRDAWEGQSGRQLHQLGARQNGFIAEGTGENFFFINKGVVYAISKSVNLTGITRESIIQICRDMGLEVVETMATREELYCADEVFMTGTAAEVTPVSEIDYRKIGNGSAGKISLEIRKRYLAAAGGQDAKYDHWLTHIK